MQKQGLEFWVPNAAPGGLPYSDLGVVRWDFWVVDQQNSVHTLDYCRPARLKPVRVRTFISGAVGVG